jgi:Cytochrome C oxidase, cbb3-type, subunit III
MKLFYTTILIIICTCLVQCKTQKIEYNIPSHVSAQNRAIFLERCEKGRILFKINCSGCHGIFTKGKDGVPNFTKDEIDNYRAVVLIARDQKNHAVAAKMSPEQIDHIITFLSLRIEKK